MKLFKDYFEGDEEYPKSVAYDILPWGMLYEYISSTFLNGLINYVELVDAFVLARYTGWDEKLEDAADLMDPPGSFQWTKFNGTKQEVFDRIQQKGCVFHTDMKLFDDDVLILAKCGPDGYYYFWFDCDVSDCCIGRFRTSDSLETVKTAFEKHVLDLMVHDMGPPKRLPLHFFSGWLKF